MVTRKRIRCTRALAVLGACLLFARAGVAEVAVEPVSPNLFIDGSLRTRWEGWNWFEPTTGENNDYDFVATVARLSLSWKDPAFEIKVEAQNSALMDLPNRAEAPAPQGPLGLGAVYYGHNRRENDAGVFLKQGFIALKRLGIDGLSLKGGRFEFSEGLEVLTGDPTLDWLKKTRLSQRLLGPFGFSHVGRAFDGGVLAFTRAPVNVTVMGALPTQGGFDLAGMKEIDDINVVYTSATLSQPRFAENFDARLFHLFYADRRHQIPSDNRDASARGADREDIEIHTQGAHLVGTLPTHSGPLDLLLWGAVQHGDWGTLDHSGWRWDTELGWQPECLPWKPWFRIGYGRSSGDGDSEDDQHETFFQVLPTTRLYSFSTFYNLMNNEDGFAQLILRPVSGLIWRTDFHNLRLTEPRDLWYQGAGATLSDRDRALGFGFPGRPTLGGRDLLRVVETTLSYDWNRWLNTNVYYAHIFGGTIVDSIFDADDADFAYLEATLKL